MILNTGDVSLPLSMEALGHAVGENLRHKLSVVWCEGGLNAHILIELFRNEVKTSHSILKQFKKMKERRTNVGRFV